jgi:hypothetical protein
MKRWKIHKNIKFTLNDWEYSAEVTLFLHREVYGEDADGNRGCLRTFLDDVEILHVEDIYGLEVLKITEEMTEAIIDVTYNCDFDSLYQEGNDEED